MADTASRLMPPRSADCRVLRTYDDGLQIVTFDPRYRQDFERLNVAWLERYFEVEPIDERVLGNPEAEILAPGGEIMFALLGDAVVGTVALKLEEGGDFELTKMAVEPAWQGRGFGKRLLETACELAKRRGASRIVLYSQRGLKAAVTMYSRFGFVELPMNDARYSRCDVMMAKTFV
jgi:GNAT superfamily N-acetyltransferase